VPSDRTRGDRGKRKQRQFHLNMRENLFEGDGALEQVAQGGCGFFFSGNIQNLPGCGPVQPAVGDPALAGGLD